MGRRRFDHLVLEISVATGTNLPRYPLWLYLRELGWNPEALSREAALAFCDGPLSTFLASRSLTLAPRAVRRLRRAVRHFDPTVPTPYEWMTRL